MKKLLSFVLVLMLCASCIALGENASGSEVVYAKVTVTDGNKTSALYQLPGEYRPVIAQLSSGSQLIVLYEGSTWHKVQTLNGLTGWMKSTEVSFTTRGISALNLTSTISGARYVNTSSGYATLRWGAGTEYDVIDNLGNGTYCWLFETEDSWCRVLVQDGRVGYIDATQLKSTSLVQDWPSGMKAYVQVSGDSANFRDAANYKSNVIGQLYSGDIVDVIGYYSGFLYVTKGSRTGYISNDIISPRGLNRVTVAAPLFYDNPNVYAGITDVMQYVSAGTLVKVLASDSSISRVQFNGIDGYVFNYMLAY